MVSLFMCKWNFLHTGILGMVRRRELALLTLKVGLLLLGVGGCGGQINGELGDMLFLQVGDL